MMTIEQKVKLVIESAQIGKAAEAAAVRVVVAELFTLSAALQSAERHLASIAAHLERLAAETTR